MKKIIICIIVVALIALFGGRAYYLHQQKQAERFDTIIKIGAILPMSGILSQNGEAARNALSMAVETFNKGQHPFKIKLVIEDGKFTAKDSLSAFRKLQSQGIDIILPYGDVASRTILPLLREKNLPLFAISGSEDIVSEYEHAIGLLTNPNYLIGQSPKFIISDLGAKDIAIVYQKEPTIEYTTKNIINSIHALGGKVVVQERFAINASDSHNIVAKVLSKNPQAVIVFGWGPAYLAILNDLRQQLFTGPIITDNNITSVKDSLVNKGTDIYVFDILFDNDSQNPLVQTFLKQYSEKYHSLPDIFAVYCYEIFFLLTNAIEAPDTPPLQIKQNVLNTVKQESLIGPISFYPNRLIHLNLIIKQLQENGSTKIVKEK